MIVGLDIDGVIFPWSDVANEAVATRFDLPDPGPHVEWLHLKKTLTNEQWTWLWSREGQDTVFRQSSRVYPGVVPAFKAILRSPGNDVHFVTHRDPRRASLHTATFLGMHFGRHPWAGLHVVQNATAKHSLMDWDVFVDDKPSTVLGMLMWTEAMVFAPARPWNTELAEIDNPRFYRYEDPAIVAEFIATMP